MKKIMYVMLGLLLLVPMMAMAERPDQFDIEKLAGIATLEYIAKTNQMFGNAYRMVLKGVAEEGVASFEAMDLLGMSFDSIQDPYNTKTTGEQHQKAEESYKKNTFGTLDMVFAQTGISLAELAEKVQQDNPEKELTHMDIFKTMDGSLSKDVLAELQFGEEE